MGKKRKGRIREFERNNSEISLEEAREERQRKINREREKRAEDGRRENSQKRTKLKINKSRVVKLVIIIFVITCFVVAGKTIVDLKIEQNKLISEQERLKTEKADLEEEYSNTKSKEYIEQQAREILKMVKPGEKLLIVEDKEDKDKD